MTAKAARGPAVSQTPDDPHAHYEALILRRRTRGERSIRTSEGFQMLKRRYGDSIKIEEIDVADVTSVFLDPRISRVITENCWRLAQFGGGTSNDLKDCSGLELDEDKYSTFNARLIQWVVPELPRRETQELALYDWNNDRMFDTLGREGLSLQGFKLSLLDLVISCTDGTVSKCLEFLNLMARWLQHSLPPYPTQDTTSQIGQVVDTAVGLAKPAPANIKWNTIPLSAMTPCQIVPHGLYCELKAQVRSAPMVMMVLESDANPIELVLAANSKLLLKNVNRKLDVSNSVCGEAKRPGCWAFCFSPKMPSILLIPSSIINHQTKALYACFRARSSGKQTVAPQMDVEEHSSNNKTCPLISEPEVADSNAQNAPLPTETISCLTLLTNIPEQSSLRFGNTNDTCIRMERMSSRIFTVEHGAQLGERFSFTLAASRLESSNAAAMSKISTFIVSDSNSTDTQGDGDGFPEAHTLVFVFRTAAARKNGLKQDEATLPRQWFTSLYFTNETKTIVVETRANVNCTDATDKIAKEKLAEREPQRTKTYQLLIFTLHGVQIEVTCNAAIPERSKQRNVSDQESEENEGEDRSMVPMNSKAPKTSAGLLKELLLLQKARHLEQTAEPLPDIVVGTQVSTTKPVESLRTKILHSRQDGRDAHFPQLEPARRDKLLEGKTLRNPARVAQEPNQTDEYLASPNSELEKRVNKIATFFHEMAVHQPKLNEIHGNASAEAAEAEQEGQLLQRFGEMFDLDVDLQNTLDEEKWSTDAAKSTRRRESLATNLPKTMPARGVRGMRDQIEDDQCTPWTFEDYESTAQYIEQLMIDVATDADQQQELQDMEDAERKREVMAQLVASWQYTQRQVSKNATRKRLNEIEQKRRNQWMKSQHVQAYSDVVAAQRSDRPERPALILPKQRFLVQEQALPSTAVWEIPGSPNSQTAVLSSAAIAPAGLVSPARPTSPRAKNDCPSPSNLRPQRPPQRPMTTGSDITALRSAAISRAHVRRIRSAHSTARGVSTPNRLQCQSITSVLSPQAPEQLEADKVSSQEEEEEEEKEEEEEETTSVTCEKEVDNQIHSMPKLTQYPGSPSFTGHSKLVQVVPAPSARVVDMKDSSTARRGAEQTIPTPRQKRTKKKKRSGTGNDVHFHRRVMELVSISTQLQTESAEEWREAQGVASVDELSLLSLSAKPKPT